jgi:hypothetical protein
MAAKEMPVLPLEASQMTAPGSSSPVAAAWRRMFSAMRSLTLSVMFMHSYFANSRRGLPSKA